MTDHAHILFGLDRSIPWDEVEGTLHLALLATESLFGADRLHMELEYETDPLQHTISILSGGPVAAALSTIFLGYCRREFGRKAVRVEKKRSLAGVLQ